jgi:arylsulfatase A-like enzyme
LDDEFGKLLSRLKNDGVLENSYVIFTADHGELFERGFAGHGFQFMYEGVLQIPLIIHAPGQVRRKDVFSSTGNIDILPTLLSIAGQENLPADIDGRILPGFGGDVDNERPIFSLFGVDNPSFDVLKKGVISMRRGGHKIIAYLGYDGFDQVFELYNLETDPDELNNLRSKDPNTFSSMKDELLTYLDKENESFRKK